MAKISIPPNKYLKGYTEFYVLRSKRQNSVHNPPEQYLKGYTEFYKLRFRVTPDVLIPRPETELLVDETLSFARSIPKGLSLKVLDIGTGCGNIAISLAKNLPDTKIIATDISSKALKVAGQNARLHKVSDKIIFLKSNLLSNFSQLNRSDDLSKVDVIVTNLPYIPSERIPYLDSSVKDFEPLIALDGGKDGFEIYRKLFEQIKAKMHPKSRGGATFPPPRWKLKMIICEIDYTHGELAANEALKYFPDAKVEVKTDLAHKQRILIIKF